MKLLDPIKVDCNVLLEAVNRRGRVVAKREGHNIFVNYGRDWLAHLIAYNTGGVVFRNDRIRYMAFGIGGTGQRVSSDQIRGAPGSPYSYPDFPDAWGGGGGAGDPTQTQTDPTVTALEWPVLVNATDYYDDVNQPATFPAATGIVRFTTILDYNELSFGAFALVPVSEIGLFTSSIPGLTVPPVVAGGLPVEKFMVAYHTFGTIDKSPDVVFQVSWELRFS
jgi:hypothetical protein